jgi:hypothetical protein
MHFDFIRVFYLQQIHFISVLENIKIYIKIAPVLIEILMFSKTDINCISWEIRDCDESKENQQSKS